MKKQILILLVNLFVVVGYAQTTNDILNLLIANKVISQEQADSIRAEAAIKQQDAEANKKSFFMTAARNIKLSGYTQVRYQNLDEAGKTNGMDIRRARLDLRGDVTPYWSYQFQADFAGSSGKLLDAVADFKPYDFLNVSIGQTKIPLSYENQISDNRSESIDRSQVVEALVARGKDVNGNHNGRDIGVLLGGNLLKIKDAYLIEYKVGLFNGEGINLVDSNEAKSGSGRILLHPIKGLDLGGSYYYGWDKFSSAKTRPYISQERSRWGFELGYEYKKISFRGEYLHGTDGPIKREGGYVQVGYFAYKDKLQLVAKYDGYDKDIAGDGDISTYYTIGANYLFNKWSKLQLAYSFREEESNTTTNNAAFVQYQISF